MYFSLRVFITYYVIKQCGSHIVHQKESTITSFLLHLLG